MTRSDPLRCPHCGVLRQTEAGMRDHLRRDHGGELLPAPGTKPPRPGSVTRCYIRVSTDEQDTTAQRLRIKAWCAMRGLDNLVWYDEKESGAKGDRPELVRMQMELQQGDVVVLLRADRLSRSLTDFVRVSDYINRVGAELACVEQPIDTTSPMGRAFWQILGVFAELERALIVQRVNDGLARAKAEGKKIGRHPAGCGREYPCPWGVDHSPAAVRARQQRGRTRVPKEPYPPGHPFSGKTPAAGTGV